MLIETHQQLSKVNLGTLTVGDTSVAIVNKARNLGVWFNSQLNFNSNYNPRSNTKHLLLDLPDKTKETTGDRAFFAASPTLWNALPDELRALGSL
ncbi:unnamed protein product [Porites lobata]|uniref:Uncharacterized protein n=1 Tax=Porites lobata TaxID=104759 RepID=A0ABN8NZJ0_9CNID|nr:unnamed protein product [Porites lobata]